MHDWGIAPPGFRLPATAHPGAVHLQVSDLAQSVDYYTTVLGLRLSSADGTTAVLTTLDDGPELVRLTERPGAKPQPKGGLLGLYHFAILLPDRGSLGRFVQHLSSVRTVAGLTGMSDHAVSEAIYLSDPDGLGIEVYADRPRSLWRADGSRQLFMTTAPLDVRDLLAAGAGGSWAGMPRGTVMGHVHLHVGDLDESRSFYHRDLGFDKTVWEYPGALFLSTGGYHHHLATNTWSRGGPPSPDHARLLSWELVVPGPAAADAIAAELRSKGHAVSRDNGDWTVTDPWGTHLRLVEST